MKQSNWNNFDAPITRLIVAIGSIVVCSVMSHAADDYYVVADVVGTSSVRPGQVIQTGTTIKVGRSSRTRLISGTEIVDIRGPQSLDAPKAKSSGRNAGARKVRSRLEKVLFNPDRPRNFRDATTKLPTSSSQLNGDHSGRRCVLSDAPEIWTRHHTDASGLKIVDKKTGAATFVSPSTPSPRWRWPVTLELNDQMSVDLFWGNSDHGVTWKIYRRSHQRRETKLEWYLRAGCNEQLLIEIRSIKPDRIF